MMVSVETSTIGIIWNSWRWKVACICILMFVIDIGWHHSRAIRLRTSPWRRRALVRVGLGDRSQWLAVVVNWLVMIVGG